MIDVIVPVRGAGVVFQRCAVSLGRHIARGEGRVIIVCDGPPDGAVRAGLRRLEEGGLSLEVLHHPAPRGFAASVNLGLTRSDARDVVLLNSDTQVTEGWLPRLAAAARSGPRIATVTPFSNHATIASIPAFLAENRIPTGHTIDSFAALVERVSARAYPALPTGVGACLYVTREAIDEVGPFSEDFGLGYGEEVDFCLRAAARGFRHLLDDATFIFHEGNRSFGIGRAARVRRAERRIAKRYPGYRGSVHEFIQRDPIAPARARVLAALRPRGPASPAAWPARVLHVVHGWPPWAEGGTERYAWWLAHAQAEAREVAVYARVTDPDRRLGDAVEHHDAGVRVRLVVNNFSQRSPLCRNGLHCPVLARDFARYLDDVRPDVVHVHHLAGHCASLLGVARRRGVPIVYQAQDWWPVCARMNFCDRDGAACDGPAPMKCARCLPLTSRPPATLASAVLHRLRRAWIRRQVRQVDAVVMGSRAIAASYAHWRVLPAATPVHVLPYGVPDATAIGPRALAGETGPIRFGVVGALLPHKGVHLCVEAFGRLPSGAAELHVWGASDDRVYGAVLEARAADLPGVRLHGAFDEAGKGAVFAGMDVLIVPSIGRESFGLTAREAWRHGVPVIAARRAALTELFVTAGPGTTPDGGPEATPERGGTLVAPDDAGALAAVMARVIGEPAIVARWRAGIPAVKTVAAHAAEIDAVYGTVARPSRR